MRDASEVCDWVPTAFRDVSLCVLQRLATIEKAFDDERFEAFASEACCGGCIVVHGGIYPRQLTVREQSKVRLPRPSWS